MTVDEKFKLLKSYPLFTYLKNIELEVFVKKAKEKTFAPKTFIINQSEPANAIYLIYKGLVKIYILNQSGRIIPIRVKEPPYLVGEMNLFDNESTATIEALQETHTLIFPKDIFKTYIMQQSRFAFTLLEILNEKLRTANRQTNHYFSSPLKERTKDILKTLAPHFPNNEISLSHEELSFLIGATRARVTEILAELATEHTISLSHRKIRVL